MITLNIWFWRILGIVFLGVAFYQLVVNKTFNDIASLWGVLCLTNAKVKELERELSLK